MRNLSVSSTLNNVKSKQETKNELIDEIDVVQGTKSSNDVIKTPKNNKIPRICYENIPVDTMTASNNIFTFVNDNFD